MTYLNPDPNYKWTSTLRKLGADDGSDKILDFIDITNQEFLNKSEWLVANTTSKAAADYDFSVSGGAAGSISLGTFIPAGSVVLYTLIDVIEDITADVGTSISITAESSADLFPVTLVDAGILAGFYAGSQTWDVGTALKITEDRTITLDITGGNLLSGKLKVTAIYVLSLA